jgi:hypothetical protein
MRQASRRKTDDWHRRVAAVVGCCAIVLYLLQQDWLLSIYFLEVRGWLHVWLYGAI